MTTTTRTLQERQRVAAVLNAIVESIQEAGPAGLPAGGLYQVLSARGMEYSIFEGIMGALVQAGLLTHSNHTYYAAPAAQRVTQ